MGIKLQRVPILTNIICNLLDTQEVRRLCRYCSLSPYDTEALDYNNEFVEQPDLLDSLLEHSTRDKFVSRGSEKPTILPQRFSKEAITDNRIIVFVYCEDIDFREHSLEVIYYYKVQICYPVSTERLEFFGSRPWEIASKLEDVVDGFMVKDELAKKIGNVKIALAGITESGKLTNNTEMGVISIPLMIHTVNGKGNRFYK